MLVPGSREPGTGRSAARCTQIRLAQPRGRDGRREPEDEDDEEDDDDRGVDRMLPDEPEDDLGDTEGRDDDELEDRGRTERDDDEDDELRGRTDGRLALLLDGLRMVVEPPVRPLGLRSDGDDGRSTGRGALEGLLKELGGVTVRLPGAVTVPDEGGAIRPPLRGTTGDGDPCLAPEGGEIVRGGVDRPNASPPSNEPDRRAGGELSGARSVTPVRSVGRWMFGDAALAADRLGARELALGARRLSRAAACALSGWVTASGPSSCARRPRLAASVGVATLAMSSAARSSLRASSGLTSTELSTCRNVRSRCRLAEPPCGGAVTRGPEATTARASAGALPMTSLAGRTRRARWLPPKSEAATTFQPRPST
jgi:hypothetical protein